MSVSMNASQKVLLTAIPPSGLTPSLPPTWSVSPDGVGALAASVDGTTAEFVASAPGTAVVSVAGDGWEAGTLTIMVAAAPAWTIEAADPVAQ